MGVPESPQETARALAAVAADLAAALAREESAPLAPVVLLDQACSLVDRLSWALCREPAVIPVGGLAEIARALAAELAADTTTAPAADPLSLQALAIGAQAGDLADAHRAWAASGGRPGPDHDVLKAETAHLLLTTAVFAAMAGIDIDHAIGSLLTPARPPGPPDGPARLEAACAPGGSRA